ncbi:fad-binding monooxygenase [Teratosphaeria destructans]|uniref:Fad-binding monooxygenase n=1 Tax=Teratosphaeria destructans TaxID=418781 RepID=A0A9W7SKY1_9PEZI|nr:fad-binding monooxygenase [Teratosphaeria destructans]
MRILISGAGIAGPCLAWWLSHSTHTIVLVEKSRTLLPQGQNIDISGAAITAVRRMGLLDAIRRLNTTERGTAGVDADGTVFASFPTPRAG